MTSSFSFVTCLFIRSPHKVIFLTSIVVFLSKWLTVGGTPGPAGPTAARIANTTVVVRAPALHLPTEANIASVVT